MDDTITAYVAAWNEPDAGERRRLLEQSLTADAQLLGPNYLCSGTDEIVEQIGRYQVQMPGTRIVPSSGVDAHHDVARYAWRIVDEADTAVMEGLDVVERADDGRLSRVVMFYGPLPAGG
jgi:hypothetical protein